MECVLEHSSNFPRQQYKCLEDPTAWLNDHVMSMFNMHMQQVLPLPDKAVCDQLFGDIHDFQSNKQKKIDFGEVVILDSTDACKIKEAYDTGRYEVCVPYVQNLKVLEMYQNLVFAP